MKNFFLKLGVCALALTGAAEALAQEQVIQLFAHRGSRFEYDENTLPAFKASYDAGLRGFETDIRMTRDGELVISHDETLARLTPCKRVVETMTADEIRKVKTNQGNDLIFLPELVDFFADKDNVYIEFEMKTKPVESYPEERLREYCEKVYNTVMAKKPANSLYLFTSSDKRALKMMRSLHPDVDLLLIISKPICEETILEAIDMGIKRLGCRIEGTVTLDGEDIFSRKMDVNLLRKRVGMVFQKPNPFPMSVYDNIAYGPRTHGIHRKAQLDEIVESSLRNAAIWDELKDRLNKSALGLSGGQQPRLCIARALAVEPEVLLMDEPTSALDPISTSKIEELCMELKGKYTIVIVTHNMQQALRIADTTAFFLLGDMVEVGATDQLFSMPRDKRTEDYITGRFG